jgi:hypothetical protein
LDTTIKPDHPFDSGLCGVRRQAKRDAAFPSPQHKTKSKAASRFACRRTPRTVAASRWARSPTAQHEFERYSAYLPPLPAAAAALICLALLTGCGTPHQQTPAYSRAFDFQKDTFSFSNELVWVYQYDANGHWTTHNRDPKPTYAQHCFVLARTTRQFFLNARFDPTQPVTNEAAYRHLIRRVVSSSPRKPLAEDKKIVIPGYADLRTFSKDQEKLLKNNCGSGLESYFQRGHWRMIFPFSRSQQAAMAEQILAELERNPPVVVHVFRFPQLTINHAVIIFGASQDEKEITFQVYDPNDSARSSVITYERKTRTFQMPANDYFPGGWVDVYEVYHKWDY